MTYRFLVPYEKPSAQLVVCYANTSVMLKDLTFTSKGKKMIMDFNESAQLSIVE